MIWVILIRSFIWICAVMTAESGADQNEFLLFAVEDGSATSIYKIDFNLNEQTKLVEISNKPSKFFISSNSAEAVLYWSEKDSGSIGRLDISTNEVKSEEISEATNKVFAGPGSNGDLYFYDGSAKTIVVTNFETKEKKQELNVPTDSADGDTSFRCRNPCDEDLVYFDQCSAAKVVGVVFGIEQKKILRSYDFNPSICFDAWMLKPNAGGVYAVKDSDIYRTNGRPFVKFYTHDESIVDFAVGNNELFYISGDASKIFKLTPIEGEPVKSEHDVGGKVIAMIVHQHVPESNCLTRSLKA